MCSVVAVAASPRHAFSKAVHTRIDLVRDFGVAGDAHAGKYVQHLYSRRRQPREPNRRQVHLVAMELIDALIADGIAAEPGSLGENVTTKGIALEGLPLGTRLRIGPAALIEVTGTRRPCRQLDRLHQGLFAHLKAIARTSFASAGFGAMAIVLDSGRITAGDRIDILLPVAPHQPLPSL
jgi:MOSC domain-containing protein YiiM